MKRSRLTSLLGITSLGLVTSSYFILLTIDSPFAYILIVFGVISSAFFVMPAIIGAYFEFHTPEKNIRMSNEPIGRIFSIFYVIFNLISSSFASGLTVQYYQYYPISPILWVIVEIFWITSGVLGIVAAVMYKDDKKKHVSPISFDFL